MKDRPLTAVVILTLSIASAVACTAPSQPESAGSITASAGQAPLPTSTASVERPAITSAPTTSEVLPETPHQPIPPLSTDSVPDLSAVRIELRAVAGDLALPVGLANAGDGSRRLFVIEKRGKIRIIQGGELLPTPFLDLTDRVNSGSSERGLLGLAFDPAYATNGYFYVNYTGRQGQTVISRFSVTDDPNYADPASEIVVLEVEQPAPNHNGGHLAFGPDGYLYIGLGDGGGAGDTFGNGQNSRALLGKMLRIDVHALPYAIPPDNPFVGNSEALPEIWATGLRNPWRYSFDRATGDLYIADVGQNQFEEINWQPASSPGGQNYGWPITEGLHCFSSRTCDLTGLIQPIAEYDHSLGCSITGGYVYRGQMFPSLVGIYFFGDFCSGTIWGLTHASDGTWQTVELLQSGLSLSSFGEDEEGELYIADMQGGAIFQIIAP